MSFGGTIDAQCTLYTVRSISLHHEKPNRFVLIPTKNRSIYLRAAWIGDTLPAPVFSGSDG